MNEYMREESLEYINKVSEKYRRQNGIYFTENKMKRHLLSLIPIREYDTILEPGCGTGEFVLFLAEYFRNSSIDGYEIEDDLAKISNKIASVNIFHEDFLKANINKQYDLIIGNPPYFETNKYNEQEEYKEIVYGRTNIFSLFIKKSIDLLKPGGILAFIVSSSMNNGTYFKNLRYYIEKTCTIEHIEISNEKFNNEVSHNIMYFIISKDKIEGVRNETSNYKEFIVNKNGSFIFTQYAKILNDLLKKYKTIYDYKDFVEVKTGSIVWNQNKKRLTNVNQDYPLLIYNRNIGKGELVYPIFNEMKPQFIDPKHNGNYLECKTGPAIAVNRIIGNPLCPTLKVAWISNIKYFAENHVNIISGEESALKEIYKSLIKPETRNIIKYVTANTQLSKNELYRLLPLI